MVSAQKNKPDYGRGVVCLDGMELVFHDQKSIVQTLEQLFSDPNYQPPRLPESALKLLELTKNPEVDIKEMTAVLEQDQLLAAELIRISLSAQYSTANGAQVRTLDDAIIRLGIKTCTELFFQAGMKMRVFRVSAYQKYMDELRRHSTLVACLARRLSRETALFDEHAFLCGLLHDVGIAASLIAIADATPRGQKPPAFEELWPALKDSHEKAGAQLARTWKLPAEIAMVIEHHHQLLIDGYPHPTCAVIEIANALAEEVDGSLFVESGPAKLDKALELLNLSKADYQRFLEEAKLMAQTIRA